MRRPALLLIAIAGCTDELPTQIPPSGGFAYFANSNTGFLPPHITMATPVGGLRTYRIQSQGLMEGFAYEAVVADGDAIRLEHQDGPLVTVRAIARGVDELIALTPDGSTLGATIVETADLARIEFVALEPSLIRERISAGVQSGSIAWAPGERTIGIDLIGRGVQSFTSSLFDSSLHLALDGAERPSLNTLRIGNLAAGTYPISIIAAGVPRTLDFVVADQADSLSVAAASATSFQPGSGGVVCFEARAAGRYLAGLTWTVSVEGPIAAAVPQADNCMGVTTLLTPGDVRFTATAGGQSISVAIPNAP